MKEPTVQDLCNEIRNNQALWKQMNEKGCNDPFWADGFNMNLARNHMIYARKKLETLCEGAFPEEYYIPVPPLVPDTYMANKKQKERVRNLEAFGQKLTCRKNIYNEEQLAF